jgi:predicted DNA-binding protein
MKTAIQVRIEPSQLARLQAISDITGNSIAAIIRHCIDKQLPQLEERFKVIK